MSLCIQKIANGAVCNLHKLLKCSRMQQTYFLLFTKPMMTQMKKKDANTSPKKACMPGGKPSWYEEQQVAITDMRATKTAAV